MIHIVLHEPEIPFNTGAIARTCVATGSALHIIKPYGFVISDKMIRRAGMDYWPKVDLHEYVDFADFLSQHPELDTGRALTGRGETHGTKPKLWYATTKAHQTYSDVTFGPDDYIMFGKESAGIPEEILTEHEENCIRIPMWGEIRSLNLSNSVAIILYEALRQNGFEALSQTGDLHRLHWRDEAALHLPKRD
ncbi:tRNA (cytidine/uridine-2'-O-)-methyltransferase [Lachnospiraceae bacterium NK3A20]|nr:tRNA (cytidine/uridine-2'-O-)-methyltransferase [Lachnospiraceae bacterium NK3A20]